jgi:hypothetical protein
MGLAEEIRHFVFEHYIKPAKERGETKLVVVSGDVHARMGLKDRMPAVCSVLRGSKLQDSFGVQLIQEIRLPNVKRDSSTNRFVFSMDWL